MPKWEKAYYLLGKFYDRMLQQQEAVWKATASPSNYERCLKTLKEMIVQYGMALTKGHRYIFQTMPRILTAWLEYGSKWEHKEEGGGKQARSRSNRSSDAHSLFSEMNTCMRDLAHKVPAYKWLTALPQLVSRFSHPNTKILEWLVEIITSIFKAYPQQALWMTAMNSHRSDRAARHQMIMRAVKKKMPDDTLAVIAHGEVHNHSHSLSLTNKHKRGALQRVISGLTILHRFCRCCSRSWWTSAAAR
jgi:serine/threonine-protein kinase ATR